MHKRNKIAIGVFVVFYICFGVVLTVSQERFIYQPWPQDFEVCEGFATAERVTYEGTRMYVQAGEKGVVVLYHGNAGSACDRSFYADMFAEAGYGYVVPEYTGYSNDGRTPSHVEIKKDVQRVVDYVAEHATSTVLVVGESIGTGLASYHASLQAPDKLLLISPFASLTDLAQRKFWFYPTRMLVRDAYDNVAKLKAYTGPVSILQAGEDKVIPPASTRLLFDSLQTSDAMLIVVPGVGHNDLFMEWASFMAVDEFLGGEVGRLYFVNNPPEKK